MSHGSLYFEKKRGKKRENKRERGKKRGIKDNAETQSSQRWR
jgi:hypothetical protein